MLKHTLFAVAITSSLVGSAAFAASFQVSTVSEAQAKQMQMAAKTAQTPMNQLFVCNSTNLPDQNGAAIDVAFPQAGVPTQTPGPGSCAYLSSSDGSFMTQVTIYTPSGSGYIDFNNILSSGQMWGVTYNAENNTYPVAQIQ